MAVLSNSELSKHRNGEYRWLKFLRKINNGEFFTLSPQGKKIFGKNSIQIKPVDTYSFVRYIREGVANGGDFRALSGVKFKEKETGVIVGLTALEKTEEFGKGAGLGGGTEQTFYIERKTAWNCADLTGGEFQGYKQSELLADYTFEDTYWKQNLDKSWISSLSDVPQTIVSSSYTQNLLDYHHQDKLVKWIEDSYRKLKVDTSFATREINKWNPADIWCSSGSLLSISSSIASCSTLKDLSQVCYSPVLKGISLKKGGTELKEVKSEPKPWKVEKMELLGWEGNQWKSTGSTLTIKFNFEGGSDKLLFVRLDRNTFKAEVKTIGSTHRNGSCGMTQLNGILDEFEAGFRFRSLKDCPDKYRKEEARKQLIQFVRYLSYDMLSCIVRHCVCQAKGHCTYLKIS